MRDVELSLRLRSIADMVSPTTQVMDVGCDHGFLSIYLIQQGIAKSALAMDVRTGPLEAAKQHVKEAGLEAQIECILSDGLHKAPMPKEDATLVIAGMGGPLILRILEECPDIRDGFKELILSPQSQIDEFRAGLREQKLRIVDENMVYDEGKYYTIVRCIPNQSDTSYIEFDSDGDVNRQLCDKYGPVLLAQKNPVLLQYLKYEMGLLEDVCSRLNSEVHADRLSQVRADLERNKLAIFICESK